MTARVRCARSDTLKSKNSGQFQTKNYEALKKKMKYKIFHFQETFWLQFLQISNMDLFFVVFLSEYLGKFYITIFGPDIFLTKLFFSCLYLDIEQ